MTSARLCFMVLSHTEPELVERLVRVLATEVDGSSVVIRHDDRQTPFDSARTKDLTNVAVDSHHEDADWGSWALTRRTLEGVSHALSDDARWEWLVLVSGQSYPLRSLSSFVKDLEDTAEPAVMGLQPPSETSAERRRHWRPFGADRARYRYRRLPSTPLWELPAVRRGLLSITGRQPWGGFSFHQDPQKRGATVALGVVLARGSVFTASVKPIKASQWWAIRRSAAEELVPLLERSNPWHQHFSSTYTSDELAIPSLLAARDVAIADRQLHAMGPVVAGSPPVLGMNDLTWLRSRSEPFARKVSLVHDAGLVDALDQLRLDSTSQRCAAGAAVTPQSCMAQSTGSSVPDGSDHA